MNAARFGARDPSAVLIVVAGIVMLVVPDGSEALMPFDQAERMSARHVHAAGRAMRARG